MANKRKCCKWCKEWVEAVAGVQVPAGFFCDIKHAISFVNDKQIKQKDKDRKRTKKAHNAAKRKFKANDRPVQLRLTQAVFNKMRVQEELLWFAERNLEPVCISCGKPIGGDIWACGHFRTRGASSALRFDRQNTFLQHNYSCNMKLSGDISGTRKTPGYKVGLINRFGREAGQAIIDYCESQNTPVTFDCADLIEMRKLFRAKFREIKK